MWTDPVAREGSEQQRLWNILEPVVRSEGLILVELNWRRESHGKVLRLYVDRAEGGVNLEECSLISRQVSDILDVEDFSEEPYHLEVSSPGLTRKLKFMREFEIFAGRTARLTVRDEDGRSQQLHGRLMGLQGEDVLIDLEGRLRAIPLGRVAKANLEAEI